MGFQRVTCDKKGTFYNSYVSGLTTFFLQHSANRGTQKNFDAFKLKLFRFAGQDSHRISDCADLTSESLAVPTLSCCTFASESQIIFIPLLALPPAAAPYRASGLVLWHKTYMARPLANVCY